MANTLQKILNKVVSPLQGAFGPNGSMSDNFFSAHEICSKLKLNAKTYLKLFIFIRRSV